MLTGPAGEVPLFTAMPLQVDRCRDSAGHACPAVIDALLELAQER
nr:hypothetical protein [Streptomyces sp. F12]